MQQSNNITKKLPTLEAFKEEAKEFRKSNKNIKSHVQALRELARQYGYKNWETLRNVLENHTAKNGEIAKPKEGEILLVEKNLIGRVVRDGEKWILANENVSIYLESGFEEELHVSEMESTPFLERHLPKLENAINVAKKCKTLKNTKAILATIDQDDIIAENIASGIHHAMENLMDGIHDDFDMVNSDVENGVIEGVEHVGKTTNIASLVHLLSAISNGYLFLDKISESLSYAISGQMLIDKLTPIELFTCYPDEAIYDSARTCRDIAYEINDFDAAMKYHLEGRKQAPRVDWWEEDYQDIKKKQESTQNIPGHFDMMAITQGRLIDGMNIYIELDFWDEEIKERLAKK